MLHDRGHQSPLIGQLTAEQTAIDHVAKVLQRAVIGGRHAFALQLLDQLNGLLIPHAATEEKVFAALGGDNGLAEPAARLRAEHKDFRAIFGGMDKTSPDWPAALRALDRLRHHIDSDRRLVSSALGGCEQ